MTRPSWTSAIGPALPAVRAATLRARTAADPRARSLLARHDLGAGPAPQSSYARVVFGTLVAVGKPPEDMSDVVVWITDHRYQLKP